MSDNVYDPKDVQALYDSNRVANLIPRVSCCPFCKTPALRFDYKGEYFECMNHKCCVHDAPIKPGSENFAVVVASYIKRGGRV